MADLNNFERVIKEDRAARESKQWRGTLLEYLEVVKADPIMTKLAHARIYDLIISAGLHPLADTDDPRTKRLFKDEPLKVFDFFADEFFGIERTIAQIVRYFHSASLKGEESRQVLYLMGPVGSGKSSLVERNIGPREAGYRSGERFMPVRPVAKRARREARALPLKYARFCLREPSRSAPEEAFRAPPQAAGLRGSP